MKIADLNHRSNYYRAIVPALFALMPLAVAQDAARTLPAKPLAFEVVSIRPSKPGSNWMIGWMTTPDGYRVTGQSIRSTIMIAYFPEGTAFWSRERLSGSPPWLDDLYDINAKVSEADLAEWRKQGATLDKKPILQRMLQAMLADRCHLVVRHVPGAEQPGYSLELGKHGPHLTETKPGEVLPEGVPLVDGGVVLPWRRGEARRMRFYGATMAALARTLSQGKVQDHTGLTGRYDFTVNWMDDPDSNVAADIVSFDDSEPLSHWDIDALGLHLRPIKVPIDTLVIEHIEKPSEN
jgi:bla regulator protein blaR1